MLTTLFYSLLALDQTLAGLASQYGPWLYLLLFLVIFGAGFNRIIGAKYPQMDMVSFVYVGEYSTACACAPRRSGATSSVSVDYSSIVAAAAGAELQPHVDDHGCEDPDGDLRRRRELQRQRVCRRPACGEPGGTDADDHRADDDLAQWPLHAEPSFFARVSSSLFETCLFRQRRDHQGPYTTADARPRGIAPPLQSAFS